MNSLFNNKKVNLGRQKELDIAKGLAILFMVIVHVNEVYQSADFEGGLYERIIEFIGSPPAAPIFMLLLGVGLVYSKNNNSKALIKRGLFLFVGAYILNFIKMCIRDRWKVTLNILLSSSGNSCEDNRTK